jgi:hypothetical protein
MTQRMRTVVIINKAQCKLCGDILTSTSHHDYQTCSCGEISVDGGKSYIKRSAKDLNNIIELSETYDEPYESDW